MCFVRVQECTSKAGWVWVIGPCELNKLWRLLVSISIIFKCPGYLALQILCESGYRHSSAVITPPWPVGEQLSPAPCTPNIFCVVTELLSTSWLRPSSLASSIASLGRALACSRSSAVGWPPLRPPSHHFSSLLAVSGVCLGHTEFAWLSELGISSRKQRERSLLGASAQQVRRSRGLQVMKLHRLT